MAKLVAANPVLPNRGYGSMRGQFTIPDDFDELPDDIAEAFGIIDR